MGNLDALLERLRAKRRKGDPQPWLRLETAEWQGGNCLLVVSIDDGQGGASSSRWRVTCQGVKEYAIIDCDGGGFDYVTSDHPVLDQYSDDKARLFFKTAPDQPDAVVGALWVTHLDQFQDWIDFDRYLNLQPGINEHVAGGEQFDDWERYARLLDEEPTLPEFLASGQGLLAEGPNFLLRQYADVLERVGVDYDLTGGSDPKAATEGVGMAVGDLKMIRFGESYIVGQEFFCEQIE